MTNKFIATIVNRRLKKLSLGDSYRLAQRVAKISNEGNGALLKLKSVTKEIILEQENADSLQPAYHNNQHIADAILCMACFLEQLPNIDEYNRQILLLVMAVHDFGHRGLTKKLSYLSHEDESIQLLKSTSLMQLPSRDIVFVEKCILGTKPENIESVYQEYISCPQNSFALMRALVNDADIAASFIEPIGQELSKLILLEQGIDEPTVTEIYGAWSCFLSHAKIVTPVARNTLGLCPD